MTNELWDDLATHSAIFLFGAKEKMPGQKKDCSYLIIIDGKVLSKLGEDRIEYSIAAGIN